MIFLLLYLLDNQILGFTHIGDFNGLSVSHITMWNPTEFGRVLKWTEQSVPMRHKEIHLGMLVLSRGVAM